MGFLEAETGAQRRAKQIEKLRDGARRDGTGNASMSRTSLLVTAQSFSVDYHREEGCDGHAGLLYIGGSGMLEFMNPASNDTVHSVEIVPGRMVAWHNNKWDHRAIASNQTRIFVALCSRGRGTFSSTTITGYCQYPAPGYVCPCDWTEKNPPVVAGCMAGTYPNYPECFPSHCCDLGGNNTCPTPTPNATVDEATTTAGVEVTTTVGVETTTVGVEATTTAGVEATTTAATVPSVGAAGASTTASSGANATGMYTGYEFCTTAAACFFNAYIKGTHYKIHKSSASYPAASCAADCVADAECEAFESLSSGTAPSCSFWMNGACDIQAGTSPGPLGYTTGIHYATFCDKNGARKAFTQDVGKCEGPSLGLSSVALTAAVLAVSCLHQ